MIGFDEWAAGQMYNKSDYFGGYHPTNTFLYNKKGVTIIVTPFTLPNTHRSAVISINYLNLRLRAASDFFLRFTEGFS